MNQKEKIVINVKNHNASVDESWLPMVAASLTQEVTELDWDGIAYVPETDRTPRWETKSGRVLFLSGLVERVREQLVNLGHDVVIKDESVWPCLEQARRTKDDLPELSEFEKWLADRITAHPRGQIVGIPRRDNAAFIELMARIFMGLQVLVISKNKKQRRWIARQVVGRLKAHPEHASNKGGRLEFGCVSRLTVSWWEMWDVLIFADPESTLADQTHRWNPLSRLARQCYVLVPSSFAPDECEQFILEMICGPPIIELGETGPEEASATVQFVNGPAIKVGTQLKGLDWKRTAIWHNEGRNDLIASLARCGLSGSGHEVFPARTGDEELSVAILVETPEHGRELQKRLPMFELKSFDSKVFCDPRLSHLQIGTLGFAEQWGIEANLLIRADGTAGWPLGPGYPPSHVDYPDGVLLLDLHDHGHRTAERNAQGRKRAYQRQGWYTATDIWDGEQFINSCDFQINSRFKSNVQSEGGVS